MYFIKDENIVLNIFKNSKFISKCFYVTNEDEVNKIISEERTKYKDATHLTYAFKLKNKQKYSDDNEPLGTAGIPIMNVIERNDLINILIIVIRYFGGTKLGAGGLIRAYGKSASDVIKDLKKEVFVSYVYYKVTSSYDNLKLLNNITYDFDIVKKDFNENIIYYVKVPENKENYFITNCNNFFIVEKIPTFY